MEKIVKNILKDLKVELTEKFDKNFSQGGFFGNKWKPKKDGSASHLIKSGTLRRSIQSHIEENAIVFTSSTPYSAIHNEGGEIEVTKKMKKFFWAKAYEAQGKTFTKSGKRSKSKSAEKWNKQAQIYRGLALKKTGSKIIIPQRQFIGKYNGMEKTVQRIAKRAIEEALKEIADKINNS